jgi:hypothetical protein
VPQAASPEILGLSFSELQILHRFLHDPKEPTKLTGAYEIPRLGAVELKTSKWGKRMLVVPQLGEVS